MSIFLTLISGKGGSGKTTIGLSIAKLLSKCEKKVLLVDCDMSTHGATYFFESSLTNDAIDHISTTKDFLEWTNCLHDKKINPIKNASGIDFIPSVKKILSDDNNLDVKFSYNTNARLKNNYDLIILDCQAGYSKLTKDLISISDICLFVLEADSVSASAMRVLYTQLSYAMSRNSLKSYQIFNKLRDDEAVIYSDIKYGTFFTNLKPILFDWSVRKSFQENMIPLINENNSSFTSDICCLTRNLFPTFKEEILEYEIRTKQYQLHDKTEEFKKIKQQITRPKLLKSLYIILALISLLMIAIMTLSYLNSVDIDKIKFIIFPSIILFVALVIEIPSYESMISKQNSKKRINADSAYKEIESIKQEIELLKENLSLSHKQSK